MLYFVNQILHRPSYKGQQMINKLQNLYHWLQNIQWILIELTLKPQLIKYLTRGKFNRSPTASFMGTSGCTSDSKPQPAGCWQSPLYAQILTWMLSKNKSPLNKSFLRLFICETKIYKMFLATIFLLKQTICIRTYESQWGGEFLFWMPVNSIIEFQICFRWKQRKLNWISTRKNCVKRHKRLLQSYWKSEWESYWILFQTKPLICEFLEFQHLIC